MRPLLAIAILASLALAGCASSAAIGTGAAVVIAAKKTTDKAYAAYAEYCPLLDAAQNEVGAKLAGWHPFSKSKLLADAKAIFPRLEAAGLAACAYAQASPSPSAINEWRAAWAAYKAWKAEKAAQAAAAGP